MIWVSFVAAAAAVLPAWRRCSLPPSSSSVGWPSGVGSGVGGGGYGPDAGCMYGSDDGESDEEWRWGDYEGGLC